MEYPQNIQLRLPIRCLRCGKQGYICCPQGVRNHYVHCNHCGRENAYVYCEKCQRGGHHVKDIHKHPLTWTCSKCKTVHNLPRGFYEHPAEVHDLEPAPDPQANATRQNYLAKKGMIILFIALNVPILLGKLLSSPNANSPESRLTGFFILFGIGVVALLVIVWNWLTRHGQATEEDMNEEGYKIFGRSWLSKKEMTGILTSSLQKMIRIGIAVYFLAAIIIIALGNQYSALGFAMLIAGLIFTPPLLKNLSNL